MGLRKTEVHGKTLWKYAIQVTYNNLQRSPEYFKGRLSKPEVYLNTFVELLMFCRNSKTR